MGYEHAYFSIASCESSTAIYTTSSASSMALWCAMEVCYFGGDNTASQPVGVHQNDIKLMHSRRVQGVLPEAADAAGIGTMV